MGDHARDALMRQSTSRDSEPMTTFTAMETGTGKNKKTSEGWKFMQQFTPSVKPYNVRCVVNDIEHNKVGQPCGALLTSLYKPENGTTGLASHIKNRYIRLYTITK